MDESVPATKADVSMLMDQMGKYYESMYSEVVRFKEEMKGHFDFAVEQIRYELRHANHDEIEVLKDQSEDHDKRIRTLEQRF
jgi:hypothetical protein